MKKIKKILALLLFSVIILSCDKGDDSNSSSTNPGQGIANITLTAGGEEFKINGPCGFASAGGAKYIGANQEGNNLRTFSSYFNITELPSTTTTYTLVEDVLDEDPLHITMNVTELSGSNSSILTEWSSTDSSGTLTLVVDGNKVTANLAGITLAPGTGGFGFTNGNVGAFANNGILTGTLTFYKN